VKTCYACEQVKPVEEFWRNTRSRDGLQTSCKACRYTPENLAKYHAAMRRHQTSQKTKASRKTRPESPLAKAKRAAAQLRYKETPAFKFQQKRYRESTKGRFGQLQSQAKLRGKELTISPSQFRELISKPCFYCGDELSPTGAGLDRIDSGAGYHSNNVVPCCGACNATRGITWTHEEMKILGSVVRRLKEERRGQETKAPLRLSDYPK
jgi:hypothetical protein